MTSWTWSDQALVSPIMARKNMHGMIQSTRVWNNIYRSDMARDSLDGLFEDKYMNANMTTNFQPGLMVVNDLRHNIHVR